MKNITRLVLAFAVATIASLAPMAHADDRSLAPNIPQERYYTYQDQDGYGTLVVKDGPQNNLGYSISVTLYQNGYVFHGEGMRSLTYVTPSGFLHADCSFWVSGSGISAQFTGSIPVSGYGKGGGNYFVNGSGYQWRCVLN